MSKRTVFTTITPLPADFSRQTVIDFLHSHLDMIDLNPLVTERHPIDPPPHAGADEQQCVWYSLTDKVDMLGKSNTVTYTCAFNNLPKGLQTHCYAPMGLDIRDRWTVGGSLPGEPAEPVELGLGAPATGLYIREEVEMKCNVFMTGFVKKTLKKSHAELVERLKAKASMVSAAGRLPQQQFGGSRPQTHSSFDKPLPTTPSYTASWGSSHSFQQGHATNQHRQIHPAMSQPSLQGQGLSRAEQWVQQQRQPQFAAQGPMPAQPTMYQVPTLRQGDLNAEPPSAFPEPLRINRSPQGSFSTSVSSALTAISGPSTSQGPFLPPPPTPPQQQHGLRSAPSVVRWPGAKDKDYSEFTAMNPYAGDDSGLVARPPTVRPGERVVVKAQQYHAGGQQQGGQQNFAAELE